MTAEAEVIRLLQRADWKRLSLAAEANDGSRVLLAPGRRYRLEGPDGISGCDGVRPWRMPEPGEDLEEHWVEAPEPPLPRLLCPAWLLRSSRLEVRGRVTACGRDALHVVATPRASIAERPGLIPLRAGRTEALVDAELGILLRVAWQPPEDDDPELESVDVTELVSLDPDPATDPARFAPPPGSVVAATWSETLGHPAFVVAKTAAGLAAGGLGALIRYWPSGRAGPDPRDPEAAMPTDDPAPELTPEGQPAGPEVGDEVLQLLHDSGTAAFEATLHEWYDVPAMLARVPQAARRTGFGGVGVLIKALADGATAAHTVSALRVGGPGRYRIDRQYEVKHGPRTVACDGQRRWQIYDDKMTVGPAEAPPSDIADLADASWLLECRIAGGELIMAGDRPAYRISAARGDLPWSFPMLFAAAVAVVDAELGVIVSLTSYLGGEPVRRCELRGAVAVPAADFRVDLPSGLRTEPEADPWASVGDADPRGAAVTPLKVAGAVAREAGKEAAKAARNFLRRLGSP